MKLNKAMPLWLKYFQMRRWVNRNIDSLGSLNINSIGNKISIIPYLIEINIDVYLQRKRQDWIPLSLNQFLLEGMRKPL